MDPLMVLVGLPLLMLVVLGVLLSRLRTGARGEVDVGTGSGRVGGGSGRGGCNATAGDDGGDGGGD